MPFKNLDEQRRYQREWKARRRDDWLFGKACVLCGSADDLQVDHIDPSLKIDHKVWTWAEEKRKEELAKCQVLCRSCHNKKTILEIYGPMQHGTDAAYTGYRCRCNPCRAAHSAIGREYRQRKTVSL